MVVGEDSGGPEIAPNAPKDGGGGETLPEAGLGLPGDAGDIGELLKGGSAAPPDAGEGGMLGLPGVPGL